MKFRRGEEVLMGLPFFGSEVIPFFSVITGAKVIVHACFDADQFLKSIEEYKVKIAKIIMFSLLLRK